MLNGVVVTYPRMFLQRWYSAALLTAATPVDSQATCDIHKLIEREYIRRGRMRMECSRKGRDLSVTDSMGIVTCPFPFHLPLRPDPFARQMRRDPICAPAQPS